MLFLNLLKEYWLIYIAIGFILAIINLKSFESRLSIMETVNWRVYIWVFNAWMLLYPFKIAYNLVRYGFTKD